MKKTLIVTLAMLVCLTAYGENYALSFIAANTDYVDCGSDTELQMGTHDLTIEFWLKTDTTGIVQRVISNGGTAAGDDGYCVKILSSNILRAEYSDGTTNGGKQNSTVVSDGSWHHCAIVYDRDDKLWVGVDGVWQGVSISSLAASDWNNDNSTFVIGRTATSNSTNSFTGSIDEVRIWNTALSQSTISDWKDTELTSAHPDISNLMVYYKFNENTGTTANDLTSDYLSGNTESDGTITGADWVTSNISGFTEESDSSLPVELSSFSAHPEGTSVVLEWITESETENLGFILERRQEQAGSGTDWTEIASYIDDINLMGQGSVTNRTIYRFVDNTTEEGMTYNYRLADVSYAGVKQYHSIAIVEVELSDGFTLHPAYPNPFNPETTIEFSLRERSQVMLSIYDMSGKWVAGISNDVYNPGTHRVVYNGSELASGTYFYRIQTSSGKTDIHKMMLIK